MTSKEVTDSQETLRGIHNWRAIKWGRLYGSVQLLEIVKPQFPFKETLPKLQKNSVNLYRLVV